MQAAYEQYRSGCQMIALLTNLEVQLLDNERVSQIHYASYELPTVLERYKHAALVQVLQQPLVKEHVYVFRDSIQLEFLAAGMWDGAEYRGTIVVGPCISKAYPPQLISEMIQKERLPLVIQRQLHQCYNALTMVDEAKQHAISHLLINVFTPGMIQPQQIEIALPPSEGTAVKFNYDREQDRELIERRYESENKLLHAYCSMVRELSVATLSSLVGEAVTSIRFNIDQPLNLNRIADTLGVHPSHLSRTFKKELGMTLTAYINTLRIEEAKYMLDSSNASVTEIASSVGYSDSNYFSKVFTKLEHVTPHAYRKRKKGNATSLQMVPS